jgi:hypothetical protein
MWRKKKFVIIALLVASMILAASISGIALAQTGSSDNTTPEKTLMARVATILGIDQQKVEDAFAQAQSEMQDEAMNNWLISLVDEGKITQQQADQYKQWWQSKPDMPAGIGLPGPGGFPGMHGFGDGSPPSPPATDQGTSK